MASSDTGSRTYRALVLSSDTTIAAPRKVSRLTGIVICNFAGASDTVTVYIVERDDSPSDKNTILVYPLAAQDTIAEPNFDYIVRPGDKIVATSTTGSRISVHATLITL